jgi:hypothetical protein
MFTFERLDSSGPERYIVVNMSPLSGEIPHTEEEADEIDSPSIHTPRTRLSEALRILLPSDFDVETDEAIEITVSDSSSTPPSIQSPLSTPTSPTHSSIINPFASTTPTHPQPIPPFLSSAPSKELASSIGKRILSATSLRDRTNVRSVEDYIFNINNNPSLRRISSCAT